MLVEMGIVSEADMQNFRSVLILSNHHLRLGVYQAKSQRDLKDSLLISGRIGCAYTHFLH